MNKDEPRKEADRGDSLGDSGAEGDGPQAENIVAENFNRRTALKWAAILPVAAPLMSLDIVSGQESGAPRRGVKQTARRRSSSQTPRFFSPAELAMVDELAEMIIPSDDHSPGARAAKVAAYLDARLAELRPQIPEQAKEQQAWRNGLKLIDRIAREMHGTTFMRLSVEARDTVLKRMAEQEPRSGRQAAETAAEKQDNQGEEKPKSPAENYRGQSQKKPPTQPETASSRKDEGEFFVFLKGRIARVYYTSEIGMLREMDYQGNRYLRQFAGYDVNGNYTPGPPSRTTKSSK
jgi:hypothetical protein